MSKIMWRLHSSLPTFLNFCSMQSTPECVASPLQSCGSAEPLQFPGARSPGDTMTGVPPPPRHSATLGRAGSTQILGAIGETAAPSASHQAAGTSQRQRVQAGSRQAACGQEGSPCPLPTEIPPWGAARRSRG